MAHGAVGRGAGVPQEAPMAKQGEKGEPWGRKPTAGAPLGDFQPASHSFRVLKGCFPLTLFCHLNQEASGATNLSVGICMAQRGAVACATSVPHHSTGLFPREGSSRSSHSDSKHSSLQDNQLE